MELLKNMVALVSANMVYISNIIALMAIWWGIKEQDPWYLYPIAISAVLTVTSLIVAKYNKRYHTALANPLTLFGIHD
jgi:positive regulator of sigma E activity